MRGSTTRRYGLAVLALAQAQSVQATRTPLRQAGASSPLPSTLPQARGDEGQLQYRQHPSQQAAPRVRGLEAWRSEVRTALDDKSEELERLAININTLHSLGQ